MAFMKWSFRAFCAQGGQFSRRPLAVRHWLDYFRAAIKYALLMLRATCQKIYFRDKRLRMPRRFAYWMISVPFSWRVDDAAPIHCGSRCKQYIIITSSCREPVTATRRLFVQITNKAISEIFHWHDLMISLIFNQSRANGGIDRRKAGDGLRHREIYRPLFAIFTAWRLDNSKFPESTEYKQIRYIEELYERNETLHWRAEITHAYDTTELRLALSPSVVMNTYERNYNAGWYAYLYSNGIIHRHTSLSNMRRSSIWSKQKVLYQVENCSALCTIEDGSKWKNKNNIWCLYLLPWRILLMKWHSVLGQHLELFHAATDTATVLVQGCSSRRKRPHVF